MMVLWSLKLERYRFSKIPSSHLKIVILNFHIANVVCTKIILDVTDSKFVCLSHIFSLKILIPLKRTLYQLNLLFMTESSFTMITLGNDCQMPD